MHKIIFILIVIFFGYQSHAQNTVTTKTGLMTIEVSGPQKYKKGTPVTVKVKVSNYGRIPVNNSVVISLYEYDKFSRNDLIKTIVKEFKDDTYSFEQDFTFDTKNLEVSSNIEVFAKIEIYTGNVLYISGSSKDNLLRIKGK